MEVLINKWVNYKMNEELLILFFRFVKGAMNIIDLLGILPYFMSLLLSLITVSGGGTKLY